ncbi:hypothetical protein A2686_01700 [Candidatus Woesebacteria bacterium RIFCSPHIGHO2_01_FULL_38_10]|uniref:OmpR/PhoB-type domain-containing protein n=1 Tax=Candidatus Woesebacteria bacterium RIFCSPLOWO2_01_FULL_39_10b TaxID=1802517 RepID=A0A1F8B7D6_9BACT|nr:MAG: hypothetical protein A2686_01700 [Candidatus Woesebacteria bacterium RIFCSPHIGHO2_01_FULL_38_10]OGM59609.1 MAG: hypothetical protein A2892_04665 [Candidatus Woesebacteria bacterium RIFCSPLOWO2_01_FULL_39_10b]
MTQSYHEILGNDYFGNLYQKIIASLTRGENVCISVISGFGTKTLFNFLDFNIRKDRLFEQVLVFDPEIEKDNLVEFTRKAILKFPNKSRLIIVRFFEQSEHKRETLEKLDSLRRRTPKSLVFLVFTDHSAVTETGEYQAKSTIFFTGIYYMEPFSKLQCEKMIKSLNFFYGWHISEKSYEKIFNLSGGIPRLVKYICKEIYESKTPIDNLEKFINSPQISFQLELLTKLLIKLSKENLERLGLTENGKIKSKILKIYFQNYQNEIVVQIFSNLSKKESKILTFFLENLSTVISIDKIADLIEMADEDFSLWAIYKTISRLKVKVKKHFNIKNFKGQGYLLQKIDF